jgi:hypothetical protein
MYDYQDAGHPPASKPLGLDRELGDVGGLLDDRHWDAFKIDTRAGS